MILKEEKIREGENLLVILRKAFLKIFIGLDVEEIGMTDLTLPVIEELNSLVHGCEKCHQINAYAVFFDDGFAGVGFLGDDTRIGHDFPELKPSS